MSAGWRFARIRRCRRRRGFRRRRCAVRSGGCGAGPAGGVLARLDEEVAQDRDGEGGHRDDGDRGAGSPGSPSGSPCSPWCSPVVLTPAWMSPGCEHSRLRLRAQSNGCGPDQVEGVEWRGNGRTARERWVGRGRHRRAEPEGAAAAPFLRSEGDPLGAVRSRRSGWGGRASLTDGTAGARPARGRSVRLPWSRRPRRGRCGGAAFRSVADLSVSRMFICIRGLLDRARVPPA